MHVRKSRLLELKTNLTRENYIEQHHKLEFLSNTLVTHSLSSHCVNIQGMDYEAGLEWDLQQDEKSSPKASLMTRSKPLEDQPLYSIQSIPGKGRGLIACSKIAKGTRVLVESPLLTVTRMASTGILERDIAAKLKTLSKAQQRQFLSLHNNFPGTNPFSGIVKTNALPCGPDSRLGGIYLIICLINHSCIANAHNSWNEVAEHETIHAVRDIEEGEEITIRYDGGEPSTARRLHLKDAFGFDCTCSLCLLPSDQVEASDARRVKIGCLDYCIGNASTALEKPDDVLAACHSLAVLLKEEYNLSAVALMARLYYDAFQICIAHGDQARASVFAELAYGSRVVCEGEDSAKATRMKGFMSNPKTHGSAGMSKRWRTEQTMVPKGLDDDSFDKWLWRQGK